MSVQTALSDSLRSYPIQWASFFRAAVLCACAFGWQLSGEQIAAVMLVVETGLTVYTHQQITDSEVQNEIDSHKKNSPANPTDVSVK